MNPTATGYLFVLLAAACWAMLGPVARVAFAEGVSPMEVAFWRALLGGSLFLVHARLFQSLHLERRHVAPMIAFAVIGVAVFFSVYQVAVEEGGAALAAVLLYTAPAWVAVMSFLWLGERMTVPKVGPIILTLMGVLGVAMGGTGEIRFSTLAIAMGLLSGLSYAFYYPFGKRYFAERSPAVWYAYALPLGALLLLPLVSFTSKTPAAWMAIGSLAVVSTYVPFLAYGAGLQRLEATRASIVATMEPVIAALLAYVWWSERFGLWGYLGAVLILSAVVLSTLGQRRRRESERPGIGESETRRKR